MTDILTSGHIGDGAAESRSGWGPLSALPGHPLMWVLIASELAVFGLALVSRIAVLMVPARRSRLF
jgi:nitric oxide reductase NorE protein